MSRLSGQLLTRRFSCILIDIGSNATAVAESRASINLDLFAYSKKNIIDKLVG